MPDLILRPSGIGFPLTRYGRRCSAMPSAQKKIFCRAAGYVATWSMIRVRIFSKSRGTAAKKCGRISCRLSLTLLTFSAYAIVQPKVR